MKKTILITLLSLYLAPGFAQPAGRKVTLQYQAGPAFRLFKPKTDSLFFTAPVAISMEAKSVIHFNSWALSIAAGLINHPGKREQPGAASAASTIRTGGGLKNYYFMGGVEYCRKKNEGLLLLMFTMNLQVGVALLESSPVSITTLNAVPFYVTKNNKNASVTFAAGAGLSIFINPDVLVGLTLDGQYFRADAYTRNGTSTPVLRKGDIDVNRVYVKPGLSFRFRFR